MTDKLNFLVKEDLWLAIDREPEFKILGWTSKKPEADNGHIKKNTALIFSHMYKDALNFLMILPGNIYEKWYAEFFQKEIESLSNEGKLEFIEMNEIVEATIAPGFPELTQGPILVRESRLFEYSKKAILPRDLDIIMGQRENMRSKGNIIAGEKISLMHIIDVYSDAVGRNIIKK